MNAPLDALHTECLAARNEIRAAFVRLQMGTDTWLPAECPTRPTRGTRPLAVWLDERTAVPMSVNRPDPSDAIFGDDPLLTSKRPWLR